MSKRVIPVDRINYVYSTKDGEYNVNYRTTNKNTSTETVDKEYGQQLMKLIENQANEYSKIYMAGISALGLIYFVHGYQEEIDDEEEEDSENKTIAIKNRWDLYKTTFMSFMPNWRRIINGVINTAPVALFAGIMYYF